MHDRFPQLLGAARARGLRRVRPARRGRAGRPRGRDEPGRLLARGAGRGGAFCGVGSGGGGPAITIAELLRERMDSPLSLVLADLYPNLPRLERARAEGRGQVTYHEGPVDVTAVPESLPGFRLICNAFHHLSPDAA